MKITRFGDLECWQEARKLANAVYVLTRAFRANHSFRLADQIEGAVLSIMNNIAEGFDSQSNREFMRFLAYARRSVSEVQTCFYVALDIRRISSSQFQDVYQQAEKARKIIDGFRRYLRAHQRAQVAQRV